MSSDIQCPTSSYTVQAFADKCYEFIPLVTTFESSVENCKKENASLLVLHNFREVQFVAWQLERIGAFGYIWATFSKQFLNTGETSISNKIDA